MILDHSGYCEENGVKKERVKAEKLAGEPMWWSKQEKKWLRLTQWVSQVAQW